MGIEQCGIQPRDRGGPLGAGAAIPLPRTDEEKKTGNLRSLNRQAPVV
jgi:hypothetical protein